MYKIKPKLVCDRAGCEIRINTPENKERNGAVIPNVSSRYQFNICRHVVCFFRLREANGNEMKRTPFAISWFISIQFIEFAGYFFSSFRIISTRSFKLVIAFALVLSKRKLILLMLVWCLFALTVLFFSLTDDGMKWKIVHKTLNSVHKLKLKLKFKLNKSNALLIY